MKFGKRYHYRVFTGLELLSMHLAGRFSAYAWNRPVDKRRAAAIAASVVSRGAHSFGPAPVVVACVDGLPEASYVIDGQHRLEALRVIAASDGDDPLRALEVPVCYVQCADGGEVDAEFRLVNQGTPVPPAYFDEEVRIALLRVADLLVAAYPKASVASDKYQRPRFNAVHVIERLSQHSAVRSAICESRVKPEEIFADIQALNAEYRRQFASEESTEAAMKNYKLTDCIVVRLEKTNFFLGAMSDWTPLVADRLSLRAEESEPRAGPAGK